jgi:hypothetical protein
MANWITSEGSLGQYTNGTAMNAIVFAENAAGSIAPVAFELARGSKLPNKSFTMTTSNTDDVYALIIIGTLGYVDRNTDYTFTVNAVETVAGVRTVTPRTFTITATTTQWITPKGSIGTYGAGSRIVYAFQATPANAMNTLTYTYLNGQFPTPISGTFQISREGVLSGITGQVSENTTYTFTLRVTERDFFNNIVGVKDREFSITVTGVNVPNFVTQPGTIIDTLDSKWVDYQIKYFVPAGHQAVRLAVVRGSLPPGLGMSETGKITGFARASKNNAGDPVDLEYAFTVQMIGVDTIIRSQYVIAVKNQELDSSWLGGRAPALLNSTVTSQNDPYYQYHFTGTNIGRFAHDNLFIFKFIGSDFDGDQLNYSIVGLDSYPLALNVDQATGWVNGTLPNIGSTVQSYDFTVQVFKRNNPLIASELYYLSITIVGSVDANIVWNSPSNVGTIRNGDISIMSVSATNKASNSALQYKIVGKYFDDDLYTLSGAANYYSTAGIQGGIFTSSMDGEEWTLKQRYPGSRYYGNSYSASLGQTVLVGGDTRGQAIVTTITDTLNSSTYENLIIPNARTLRHVLRTPNKFIAVGDNSGVYTAEDPSSWTKVTLPSTVVCDLKSVAYDGDIFVAVGSNSTILTSANAVTWTPIINLQSTYNFNSVTWAGDSFVAVGDYGIIGVSDDAITWKFTTYGDTNLNSVASDSSATIAVGAGGKIIRSTDRGNSWKDCISNTVNDLHCVYFNAVGEPTYVEQQFLTSNDFLNVTASLYNSRSVAARVIEVDRNDPRILTVTSTAGLSLYMNLTCSIFGIIQSDLYSGYPSDPDQVPGDFPPYIVDIDYANNKITVSSEQDQEVLGVTVLDVLFKKPAYTSLISEQTARSYMRGARMSSFRYHTSMIPISSSFTFYDLSPKSRDILNVVGATLFMSSVDKLTAYMNVTGPGVIYERITGPNGQQYTKPPVIVAVDEDTKSVTLNVDQSPNYGLLIDRTVGFNKPVFTSLVSDTDDENNWYAVGDAGTILTSIDGIAWSSPTLGLLPPNLRLLPSGEIAGRLAFESTNRRPHTASPKKYSFRIMAYSPDVPEIRSTQDFYLTTVQAFVQPYDNIYIRALMSRSHREIINSLLNDPTIIPADSLYRAADSYFGLAKNVTYQHMFGIPSTTTQNYIDATSTNHYWRFVVLGELKTAIARDEDGNVIYEVVYSEIVDSLINNAGKSISKDILWPTQINYRTGNDANDVIVANALSPNSIPNMQDQIELSLGQFADSKLLPHWMRTQQETGSTLGFVRSWVICYTKPGRSAEIMNNIKNKWEYILNQTEFEMDRFEVDRSLTFDYDSEAEVWGNLPSAQPFPTITNSYDKYILFPQKTILPNESQT